MGAFRFTLQPVLEQRLTIEELRQRMFAQAQAALEEVKTQARAIEEDIAARKEQVREGQAQAMDFTLRRMFEDWIALQTQRRAQMQQQLDELAAKAEAERVKLVKAVQGRMVMEKLREKEFKHWQLEQNRAELKQFDEIAVRNFAMERRETRREARS